MNSDTRSYWNMTAEKKRYPALQEDRDSDVLIIGGGITGITCAYRLAGMGRKPVLIEAGELCGGTTGNTTGKVTLQHNLLYSDIVKKHGEEFAGLYAESQRSAMEFVREQTEKLSIDCQLTRCSSYVFAQTDKDRDKIHKEYKTALSLGIEAEFLSLTNFPPDSLGLLGFRNQYAFHPVRYCMALSEAATALGAEIHCDTKAIRLDREGDESTVQCLSSASENPIRIRAKHIVMATQYPFYDGPNLFYTRLYASRAYGIAVDPNESWPDGNYINVGDPARSIRTHVEDGRRVLIVVGENHFPGRGEKNMEVHYNRLIDYARNLAGVNKVLAKWSAQDYDTPDMIPYICRIADGSEIYAATGYGKWGLSNGTLAGNMIAELITEGKNRYEAVYSRKRSDYSSSLAKTVADVAAPIGELIKSKLEGTEELRGIQPGEGRVIRWHGHRAGIYRDYDDSVTVLDISCTHMSTELNFNSAEKTWDCPAHGGRFGTDGKLLEGPPKDPLKVYFRGKLTDLTRANHPSDNAGRQNDQKEK